MPLLKSIVRASAVFTAIATAQDCAAITDSLPNPIVNESLSTYHPISGTVNGTVAILPISYELARSIVPAEWPILTRQYRRWLPWLPHNKYPAMLQTALDHDIYLNGTSLGTDFSRAGISFPFIDRLNDGYTAMAFNHEILISEDATGVIPAFEAYGYVVTPANFEPECNGYASTPRVNALYRKAFANDSSVLGIEWELAPVHKSPYTIDLYVSCTTLHQN